MMTAMHPSIVPAHCTPKFCIICLENSGKAHPMADRRIVLAAMVDAALLVQLVNILYGDWGNDNGSYREG
jgi:hypothetical protein